MKKIKWFFIVALVGIGVSCSSSSDDDDDMNPPDDNAALIEATNYFNDNLKSIITSKCVSCHLGKHNKDDGFNYSTFSRARNSATNMYNQVNSGNMPQGGDKLPQDEIDIFEEFKNLVAKI